jgi:hypothetical protein
MASRVLTANGGMERPSGDRWSTSVVYETTDAHPAVHQRAEWLTVRAV